MVPSPSILLAVLLLFAISSFSFRHVQTILRQNPVYQGILENNRVTCRNVISYCVSSAVEDQSKSHSRDQRSSLSDVDTSGLKKTFYNHFTRTRFTVDCDDVHREIFREDSEVSSDIKVELLNISMVEQASLLLTLAHYKPLQTTLTSRIELLSKMMMHIDDHFRMQLYDRVLQGFLSRSSGRLQYPSLDYSHESLILVATHRNSNELVGITEIYPTKDTYLCNLAVHPSFRRRGVATILCSYCERIARLAWRSDMVTLHVERRNEEARRFYLSLGYTPFGSCSEVSLDSLLQGDVHLLQFKKPIDAIESL